MKKNKNILRTSEAENRYIFKNAQPGLEKCGSYKKKECRAQRDLRATFHVRRVFTNSSSVDSVATNLIEFWAILGWATSLSLAGCKTSGKRGYIVSIK